MQQRYQLPLLLHTAPWFFRAVLDHGLITHLLYNIPCIVNTLNQFYQSSPPPSLELGHTTTMTTRAPFLSKTRYEILFSHHCGTGNAFYLSTYESEFNLMVHKFFDSIYFFLNKFKFDFYYLYLIHPLFFD